MIARRSILLVFLPLVLTTVACRAQTPPKHEFRGAWIATVINLDWPTSRTASPQVQQDQLVAMLDALKAAGINAVFFQIRAESDALYASSIEPWSYWLTGAQGQPPEPFYDPLTFAIDEAHQRGMELHAWFNPFRAVRGSGYPNADNHVSQTHPEWILSFGDAGSLKILDPGQPAVHDYVTTVIMDVVRRYDVDGVHFDDYFYPYPPNQITDEDDATFEVHNRGFTDRGDWRRDNINRFVAQVYDSIQAVRPEVAFGISPFGIWRNGVPAGIVGMDAYDVIYADATAWLDAGTIDYVVPQLYWPFGGGQDYARLASWWSFTAFGQHLYTGHGLYRASRSTFSGTLFAANEVPRQVRYNRGDPGIRGSVFFRAKNLTQYTSKGFADSLRANLYHHPALTPPMDWKDQTPPDVPLGLTYTWAGEDAVRLSWSPPPAKTGRAGLERYALYRIRSAELPDFDEALADATNLLAVTGTTSYTDRPGQADEPYYYVVTSVSPNSIESAPSNSISLEGRAVAVEVEQPVAFRLLQNYPNPFNPSTEIRFELDRAGPVTLAVFNVLGQRIATLVDGTQHPTGLHTVRWNGLDDTGQAVASGTYFYVLRFGDRLHTKSMVLVK